MVLLLLFLLLPWGAGALSPCTGSDAFNTFEFDAWQEDYHEDVSEAVEEYVAALDLKPDDQEEEEADSADQEAPPIQCAGGGQGVLQPAGSKLQEIANRLPEWSGLTGQLSQSDTPAVLLAYANAYECALMDYKMTYTLNTYYEIGARDGILALFDFSDLFREATHRREVADSELIVVRPAIERTLTALHGLNRLSEFSSSMECLQASSLDLRNVTSLLADASSCLPRVWDQMDVLRDVAK